jgi:glycerol-3-phosphate dehydrogenase
MGLAVPEAIVMTEAKRILFVIPWGDRTILGTTDTDFTGSLESVTANAEDIRYILEITNSFFPAAQVRTEDVISTWAGLRPLIADPDGNPSDISRSHEISNPEPGWWDVAGGKLTTYRLMAEQTVDRITKALPSSRGGSRASVCRTADEPLLPSSETSGVSSTVPPEFGRAVVDHFCRKEWALHLSDVMVRRTSWHYYLTDAAQRAEEAVIWMARNLGWSDTLITKELEAYKTSPQSPPAFRD